MGGIGGEKEKRGQEVKTGRREASNHTRDSLIPDLPSIEGKGLVHFKGLSPEFWEAKRRKTGERLFSTHPPCLNSSTM